MKGVTQLTAIESVHVATYIEQLSQARPAPTANLRLAALRHLFDWMVIGQIMPTNPAAAVRGPRHVVRRGKTPVLDPAKARQLIDAIDTKTVCGHCGRRLHTHYRGRSSSPGYHCPGRILAEGRGVYCLNIGGIQIDEAVTRAFIAALEPAKLAATVAAAERLKADRETSLRQWRLGVERASYEASRAERRYRAVDPDNRLVARGLEREGRSARARSKPPRPSFHAAKRRVQGRSPKMSAVVCLRLELIWPPFGMP
jgi:hypothetical protein